jgi:hypothetical protein
MTNAIHLAYALVALSSVGGGAFAHYFFQFESSRWTATIAGACLTPVLLGLTALLAVPLGALALAGLIVWAVWSWGALLLGATKGTK